MATILVIEDDPIILENTLELLELEGFAVIGAVDGIEGVERAQQFLPDVVVCDVLMPRLNGYDVLRELRAHPATHAIPLVFVSATPREELLAAIQQLGVSDYLIKPFKASDLLHIIRKLIANRASP